LPNILTSSELSALQPLKCCCH